MGNHGTIFRLIAHTNRPLCMVSFWLFIKVDLLLRRFFLEHLDGFLELGARISFDLLVHDRFTFNHILKR